FHDTVTAAIHTRSLHDALPIFIGPSGAGKSTLLRLMNVLEKPDQGEVVVNGQQLTQLSQAELRKARQSIGMIFQHFNLLSNKTVDRKSTCLNSSHVKISYTVFC